MLYFMVVDLRDWEGDCGCAQLRSLDWHCGGGEVSVETAAARNTADNQKGCNDLQRKPC